MKDLNALTLLQKIAKVWQIQLNIEYKNRKKQNTRLAFKDIGPFCELLATDYNSGFVGSGTGGLGLDLVNYKTHKTVEVKSCCTIQNAICNDCGSKFNDLFNEKCPKCKSTNIKKIKDSRFGIDAKEFLRQFDNGKFENFTMCYISLLNQNKIKGELIIKLEWFKLDFNDLEIKDEQLKYFRNQVEHGRKPHCNLLPYSYDFYKLCPIKIDEKDVIINYKDINITPKVIDCKFKKNLCVPLSLIPNAKKGAFMSLKTYLSQQKIADAKDFSKNIDYKIKSLGKKRGDTRKRVDEVLG